MFSTAEALLCGTYTPLGQVQIGPLDSLSGQLVLYQIPDGIISTLKLADAAVTLAKLSASSVNNSKVTPDAAILESKLALNYGTTSLNDAVLLRELLANKDVANGYLGLDATAKVPLAKLNPLTNAEIAAGAAILESKLNLDFSTDSLNTDIQTREESANKGQTSGYCDLDSSTLVPLNRLSNLSNAQIAAAAAIVESKLSLTYGTQALHNDIATRALQATYAAHNHSVGDPTQVDHDNLINVLPSQHHVKYTDVEAVAAVEDETTLDLGDLYPKVTDSEYLGSSSKVWKRLFLGSLGLYMGENQDVNLYRSAANLLKTDDEFDAGGGLRAKGVVIDFSDIYDMLSYGAGNAAWVPCSQIERTGMPSSDTTFLVPQATGTVYAMFLCPKPTNKDSFKLWVKNVKVNVNIADGSNYIDEIWIKGVKQAGGTDVYTDPTNVTSAQEYITDNTVADDMSSYTHVLVILKCQIDTVGSLRFGHPLLECYYAA